MPGVLAATSGLAGLTVLVSWPAVLGGLLYWVWLWRGHGFDRVSRWVLAGWGSGAVLLGIWLLGSGGGSNLLERAVERVAAIDPAGSVARQ